MAPEERKTAGPALNALKDKVGAALEARAKHWKTPSWINASAGETLDLTLPPRPQSIGHIHP